MSVTAQLCNFSGRSFTDVLSNVVFLEPFETSSELLSLLRCSLDARHIPLLMHEFVHHQSLLSPVGNAICLLGFGSQRAGWVMNDIRDQNSVNLFSSRSLRYFAVNAALRPLAEGLALLAEHDLYPPSVERPGSLVSFFTNFIGTRFYPNAVRDYILSAKLSIARLGHKAERKADLLAGAMSASDGGYLLGYCLVKALWRKALARDEFFRDVDSFLNFALGILYGDRKLVCLMLDIPDPEPTFKPYEFSVTIAQRAIRGLTEFFESSNLSARREQIQTAVLNGRSDSNIASDYLSREIATSDDFRKSDSLIDKWTEEQNGTTVGIGHNIPSDLRNFQNGIWNLRHFVRLMTLPAEWTTSGNTVEIVGKSFYLKSTFSSAGQPRPQAKGSLEVVFSNIDKVYLALLVSGPHVLILDSLSRGTAPLNATELFDSFQGLSKSLEQDRRWAEWMEQTKLRIMTENEWARFDEEVARAVTEVYVRHVADEMSPTRRHEFVEATSRDGLFGIFQTTENIHNLAYCSVLCTNGPSREHFLDGWGGGD
jgi:hypothetical protein